MSRALLVPRDTQVSQVPRGMPAPQGCLGCRVPWVCREPKGCQGPTESQVPEGLQEYLGSEVPLAPLACQEPPVQRVSQEHQDCRAQQAFPQKAQVDPWDRLDPPALKAAMVSLACPAPQVLLVPLAKL